MSIRIQLALWYAGALFASLLMCSALLYKEWVIEPRREHPQQEPNDLRHGDDEDNKNGMEGIDDLWQNVLLVAVPATILGLGGGWWLMRKALAPVATLTLAVERVNETHINIQLPRTGNGDEFDRLTGVFNEMTARLADSFQRVREFTLRASHELKTPLTIMRGSMETALSNPLTTPQQRANVLDELHEVERLTKIVDGLTLLTKADAGLVALKHEPVVLDDLVRDVFADAQVLARDTQVNVSLEACDAAVVLGDNYRLRQMLLNLADNAIKYNLPDGLVVVDMRSDGCFCTLTISNTGPGVPSDLLPRLFDPFFRGDEAHSRDVDGCGLGLAIVHWIVSAHGGTINISSEPRGLTTVIVRLPEYAGDLQRATVE